MNTNVNRKAIVVPLILAVLIIGGPYAIGKIYNLDTSSDGLTTWSGSDILSYYGTILGAFVGIFTLAATISFTRKQILRENYLKTQSEKWMKIEEAFSNVLDAINPLRPLSETMDAGMTDPVATIFVFQKYQMSCKVVTDQVIVHLNDMDYPKVEKLYDSVIKAVEEFSLLYDKEKAVYSQLRDFKGRSDAEKAIRLEAEKPQSFNKDILDFCQSLLDKTKNISFDNINEDIAAANKEVVEAYNATYRELLQLKRQTFELINSEMQRNANNILRFGITNSKITTEKTCKSKIA